MTRSVERALANQRDRRYHAGAMIGQEQRVGGHIEVRGIGFANFGVQFPVQFTQRPVMAFMGEVAPGTRVDRNTFPELQALVREWTTVRMGDKDNLIYIGCRFLVRTRGLDKAVMILHWSGTGPAIVDPTKPLDEPLDGPI